MSRREPPKKTDDRARQEAIVAEVQLTLAQAQRAMAEALLALSQGTAPPSSRGARAVVEDGPYLHSGTIDLRNGELVFLDDLRTDDQGEPLVDFADNGKRMRLEVDLSKVEIVRTDEDAPLYAKLGDFLRRRAAGELRADITCGSDDD